MATQSTTNLSERDLMSLEEAILKDHEPTAHYEPIDVPGISQGRQSRVSVLRFKLARGDELIIWKRMGVGKGLTRAEALTLHNHLRTYRRELRTFGWNVPKLFHTHTVQ